MRGIILMDKKKLIKRDDIDNNNEDTDKKSTELAGFFKSGENYIGHLSRKTEQLARILERKKKN